MSWADTTFAALRLRSFRLLWIGTLCGHLAFFMSTVVQSVVAFELVGNNTAVGTVVFAQGIAMLLLGPLGGAIADRWPKRMLIASTQVVPAAVFATLALAMATESITLELITAGALLIGASFAFLGPARQAFVVEIVPDAKRGNAVALMQVGSTASQLLGPGLAGVLLYWSFSGEAGAYAVMSGLYVAACVLLLLLPRSRMRHDAHETHVLADVAEGIRYVWQRRRLRRLVLLYIAVIMLGFPYVTVMPGLLENQLGRTAQAYAFLSLTSAAGALVSSVVVARYADHARATLLFVAMGLLFGVSLFALAGSPSYRLAAGAVFRVGFGFGGFMTLIAALIVRSTEPAFFGRVIALTMLAFGAFGLMGLPVGLLADALGERGALMLLSGCVCAAVAVLGTLLLRDAPEVGGRQPAAKPDRPAPDTMASGGTRR